MNISVIICCYNSVPRLPETLKHLAEQMVPQDLNWEVIVVDNNSSDDTAQVAKELWVQYGSPVNLKVVPEREPGLSHARKKGVYEANGEIIVFCDDDNWLATSYVKTSYELMKDQPEIGVLGGSGWPVSDEGVEIPIWFWSKLGMYACGAPQPESGDVSFLYYSIAGAGQVLRRKVLLDLYDSGFVNLTLDRKGETLSSGGDTEISYWHLLVGYQLHYSCDLVFWHYMPPQRLQVQEYDRQVRESSKSKNVLEVYKPLIKGIRFRKNKFQSLIKFIVKRSLGMEFHEDLVRLPMLFKIFAKREAKGVFQSVLNFRRLQSKR